MVRIGIIGLGFMGRTHWGFLNGIKGAEVVAGTDVDMKRVKKDMAAATGNIDTGGAALSLDDLTIHDKAADLLADPDIDAVDICTPPWEHTDCIAKALTADKHVFCEKPAAHTSASAKKAVEAANDSKKVVVYGHCIRFWPEYAKTKQLVDSGAIGKVLHAHFCRQSPIPSWGWFLDRDCLAKVGGVLDLHIHDSDYAMYLWGMPDSVTATGSSRDGKALDSINAIYRFPKGPAVSIFGSWGYAPSIPFDMGFDIIGETGTIRFQMPGHPARVAGQPSLVVHKFKGKDQVPKIPVSNGWIEELKYFVECVTKGTKAEIGTPQHAYDSLRVAECAIRSAKSGKAVKILKG